MRRVLAALKASVEEIMNHPSEPIFVRAAKDFEIPGIKQQLNTYDAYLHRAIALNWLGEGKENLLRNVPRRFEEGCDALRQVGFADVKDPTALYTNKFVDEI